MTQTTGWITWVRRAALAVAATGLLAACGGGGGSSGAPGFGDGNGGGGIPPSVADLTVVLSSRSVANNSDGVVEVTVTSIDGNRAAVGGVPITFSIDNGGVVTPAGTATAATTGVLKATASIGADRTNRTINVTVKSGSISKTVPFDVVDSVSAGGGRVADLAMVLDRPTIPNDGSVPLRVTVTTLDASRQAIGGSSVTFTISDPVDPSLGRAFVTAPLTTDASTGQLVATVSLGNARTNRAISLTATSGTVPRTISFNVVDATNPAPVANDLTLDLNRTNIGNTGSDFVTVTATVVDARRNVVVGAPVSFSSDTGNVTVLNGLTNANGQARAEVRIGGDKSNRTVSVTASSGNLPARTAAFTVTGVTIQATATPALPAANSPNNTVEFRVVDSNQSAMVGIPITVTPSLVAANANAGPVVATGFTGANGAFIYNYTAPGTPGPLTITATAAGQSNAQTVTVPSQTNPNVDDATEPNAPTLTLSSNVVKVNLVNETTNRVEVRALFLDGSNKPVKNVRVRFDLNNDPLSIGGSIAAGDSIVYTDANGIAVTSYAAGVRSSPTNGVNIRVCWKATGAESAFPKPTVATPCEKSTLTSLTVVSDPLSVSIGTDNTIQNGPTGLTYVKQFVLLVVDAAGNPKADVQLTPQINLTTYSKGFYTWNPGLSEWVRTDRASCQNEDRNRNGVIDGTEDTPPPPNTPPLPSEIFGNGNGQLDPRKSDVAVSLVGGTRTDANGTAVMKLEYPKSLAGWVNVDIQVTASGVLSPPARLQNRRLDVDAAALKTETPPPAFVNSPYGTAASCFIAN
jgi:Bacterial Ig-like domain (group 1)